MDIEYDSAWAASASETEAGYLILLSRTRKNQIDLMGCEVVEIGGRVLTFLTKQVKRPHPHHALDPLGLRANFSSTWGSLMTKHILLVHAHLARDQGDIVAYTAWRYATLTAWGEASAARELSLDMRTSVHTIRTRLQLARERGILPSPGSGVRLGR